MRFWIFGFRVRFPPREHTIAMYCIYLYKMNRLGQVLGEGCTRMWETILPRAIATFCRWGNIVLFTFYLTNNSEVQPTLPQWSLWSIYRDRMSTLDVPLRTSCAPRLVATSVLLVIFQKMGNLLELLRCKTINTLQLTEWRVKKTAIIIYNTLEKRTNCLLKV